jgi:hypothetical protein
VVVHYHIFKNAGTSIDQCLGESFGDRWDSYDPDPDWANVTTTQLLEYLTERPDLRALSSHQLRWPHPTTDMIRVHPLVFVRHPIDRVASVYAFLHRIEHRDAVDRTFSEFVDWLTSFEGGMVGCSFQTLFLSDDDRLRGVSRATSDHLAQAVARIDSLPAFGIVERFDESVTWFEATLRPTFAQLRLRSIHHNSLRSEVPLEQRLQDIEGALGSERLRRLVARNEADLELYEHAVTSFAARHIARSDLTEVAPG